MTNDKISFSIVKNSQLCDVLEDYWSQANRAYKVDSFLGTIVGCGSVVEGLLTWALLQRKDAALKSSKASKDKDSQVRPLEQWNLSNLIEVAIDLELIGKTARQAAWALKDFRNFIHPYNLLTQSARPDRSLATSALAAVAEIKRSLEGRLPK